MNDHLNSNLSYNNLTVLSFKIIAEFNRIMRRDMEAVFRDYWSNLVQNVLVVAAQEHANFQLQLALKSDGHHTSNGM